MGERYGELTAGGKQNRRPLKAGAPAKKVGFKQNRIAEGGVNL